MLPGDQHDRAVGVGGECHPEFQDHVGPRLHRGQHLMLVFVRGLEPGMKADRVVRRHQHHRRLRHRDSLHDNVTQVRSRSTGGLDQGLPAERLQTKRLQETEEGASRLIVSAVHHEHIPGDVVGKASGTSTGGSTGRGRRRRRSGRRPGRVRRGLGFQVSRDGKVRQAVLEPRAEPPRQVQVVREWPLGCKQPGRADYQPHIVLRDLHRLAQRPQVRRSEPNRPRLALPGVVRTVGTAPPFPVPGSQLRRLQQVARERGDRGVTA
jgi:hypothetical protein